MDNVTGNASKGLGEVEELKKQRIALFRFRVIAALIGLKPRDRGKRNKILQQISCREWEIPYSDRSYIGRSTAGGLAAQIAGQRRETLRPVSKTKKRQRGVQEYV